MMLMAMAVLAAAPSCEVAREGTKVELRSPSFVFRLDARDGLRAESWENRRTGKTIALGRGPEIDLDLGEPGGPLETPAWRVEEMPRAGAATEAIFTLVSPQARLEARATYRWDAARSVLAKVIEIANRGDRAVRLLNLRLGTYRTGAKIVEREQGFPVYLDDEFFMSLAHPAGFAMGKDGQVGLRQHPGTMLAPGASFASMEAVYGAGEAGAGREAFVSYVRSRMRRVVRGHDRPYAIFDNFGSWSIRENRGRFGQNTEEDMLYSLGRLAESQRAAGCRFDIVNIHFWVDHAGDLERFDPRRFPNGLRPIEEKLDRMGIAPGLWIDSSMGAWSIGANPAVAAARMEDPGWLCRASEPIKSMYVEAFRHHIRQGCRLFKFDNLRTVCNNPAHTHLPGVYSTEAIENAVIEFLHALDAECPDVFLILYWGYRSPWWLLHGDTLFDSGLGIEAASPSALPAPHARDSVTQKLDQAQWHASDVPALGKDSLGVWLSDWGWNSSIGKERWQEGVVMDISRGSLLLQLWADREWLSPPEWRELADFLALLRAQPACFANPRFILGSPWRDEPYGYACADGRRAFLAIHNTSWQDRVVTLSLDSSWGLPDGTTWDLVRWYPAPARLRGGADAFGSRVSLALRPFEVVLIEAIPHGQKPSLDRPLRDSSIPQRFSEASRAVEVAARDPRPKADPEEEGPWTVLAPIEASSSAGTTLTRQDDGSILASGENPPNDTYTIAAETDLRGITAIRLEALPDPSHPSGGPGRASNGNFALLDFRVTAAPRANPAAAAPVAIRSAVADFSQESYGGWPVAAAIDGDPKTGWSVDPQEGLRHVALFEFASPIDLAGGARLVFRLDQGDRQHTLGRLRFSVTTAKPPLPVPKGYGPRRILVEGRAPATDGGGLLVVAARIGLPPGSRELRDIGSHFSAEGTLDGREAAWTPVLGTETYPSSWQAWRIEIEAGSAPRAFALSIETKAPIDLTAGFQAHFIPR
ncbi:MAG: hypothetical protein JXP34_23510 [Planctomycetes bacterium]|nr:hypothetical protein [Planctomycetota bacterium]